MKRLRHTVGTVAVIDVPNPLPCFVARPRQHVLAVIEESLAEVGPTGRAALAWTWALTGTRPSPVTLSLAPGRAPSREEILAEADADPDGSTAPPGVPTDYCDQVGEARRILAWLAGTSDDIPLDDGQRGRFVGARDDYVRTDQDISRVRDIAARGLSQFDLSDSVDAADSERPGQWPGSSVNAAWQRGVCDLLEWVLGDRTEAPLTGRTVAMPTVYDLTHEEAAAEDLAAQGGLGGPPADPFAYPPPHYGEAVLATIAWLRGESIELPVRRSRAGPSGASTAQCR